MSVILSPRITLGEAIQKISTAIYYELIELLQIFNKISCEGLHVLFYIFFYDAITNYKYTLILERYVRLKHFLYASRKKLLVLHGICKWFKVVPNSVNYYQNINLLEQELIRLEASLNESQDLLYFSHSHLFNKRIPLLPIAKARDILAKGTYSYFPEYMFTLGKKPLPISNLSTDELIKNIHIYIRSKLLLYDNIPSEISNYTIEHGLLILKQNNLYELALTLSYLKESAPWRVVGFKILVDYHPSEFFNHLPPNIASFEKQVYDVLVSKEFDTSTNSSSDSGTLSQDTSLVKLSQYQKICTHASLAIVHRYFYLLSLNLCKTSYKNYHDVTWREKPEGYSNETLCIIYLHKSIVSEKYVYNARIIYSHPSCKELVIELWATKDSDTIDKVSYKELLTITDGKINGLQQVMEEKLDWKNIAEYYSDGGVHYNALLQHLLVILAESKLNILYERLVLSLEYYQIDKSNVKILNLITEACCVTISLKGNLIKVMIDNRTGRYIIAEGDSVYNLVENSNLTVFLNDINSIESESIAKHIQFECGISNRVSYHSSSPSIQALYKVVQTFPILIHLLHTKFWFNYVKNAVGSDPVHKHKQFLFDKFIPNTTNVPSLVFTLETWKSCGYINDILNNNIKMFIPSSITSMKSLSNGYNIFEDINDSQKNKRKKMTSNVLKDSPDNNISLEISEGLYISLHISSIDYSAIIHGIVLEYDATKKSYAGVSKNIMTIPLTNNANIYEDIQNCIYNCYQIIHGINGQYVIPNILLQDKNNVKNLVINANDTYHTLLRWSTGKEISAIMYYSDDEQGNNSKYQYISDDKVANILSNHHILANGVFYLYRLEGGKCSILCESMSLNLKNITNDSFNYLCHHFSQHVFSQFVQISLDSLMTGDVLNRFTKIWNVLRLFIEIIHGIVNSNMKIIHYDTGTDVTATSICYAVYTKVVKCKEFMNENEMDTTGAEEYSLSSFKKLDFDINNSMISISDMRATGNKLTIPLESFNVTSL